MQSILIAIFTKKIKKVNSFTTNEKSYYSQVSTLMLRRLLAITSLIVKESQLKRSCPLYGNVFIVGMMVSVEFLMYGCSITVQHLKRGKDKPNVEKFFDLVINKFLLMYPGYIPKRKNNPKVDTEIIKKKTLWSYDEFIHVLESFLSDYNHRDYKEAS